MKLKEEREQLNKLLEDSPDKLNKNTPAAEAIPEIEGQPLIDVDVDDLNSQCEKEARTMILNTISFILPEDMQDESLKNKIEVDILSLSGMIYQLKINQQVQKALITQISSGLVHARYFEVFAGMSKTISELNKQLIQTVEALKETYRGYKNDVKEKRTEALGPSRDSNGMLSIADGSVVTRGTKELINNVKRIKQQISIEDDFINDETS